MKIYEDGRKIYGGAGRNSLTGSCVIHAGWEPTPSNIGRTRVHRDYQRLRCRIEKFVDLQFLSCILINTPVRKLTTPEPLLSFGFNEPQLRNLVHSNSFIFHHNSQLKSLLKPVHSSNSTSPHCHCVTNPNSLSLLFSSLSIFLSAIQ